MQIKAVGVDAVGETTVWHFASRAFAQESGQLQRKIALTFVRESWHRGKLTVQKSVQAAQLVMRQVALDTRELQESRD